MKQVSGAAPAAAGNRLARAYAYQVVVLDELAGLRDGEVR